MIASFVLNKHLRGKSLYVFQKDWYVYSEQLRTRSSCFVNSLLCYVVWDVEHDVLMLATAVNVPDFVIASIALLSRFGL